MTDHISAIRLRGVLPQVFDNAGDRERVAGSDVMLCDVDFERGRAYCLNASSGRGKSSLCSFLYGARRDYVGKILLDDTDIASLSINDICHLRRDKLAYLSQELEVFASLTALENVILKNRLTDYKSEADIRAMFERLAIDDCLDRPAGRMSVGQRQRMALIRALCQPFDFIILDEPVSHLDRGNNETCARMVADEAAALGAGIISTSVGNPLLLPIPVIPMQL